MSSHLCHHHLIFYDLGGPAVSAMGLMSRSRVLFSVGLILESYFSKTVQSNTFLVLMVQGIDFFETMRLSGIIIHVFLWLLFVFVTTYIITQIYTTT